MASRAILRSLRVSPGTKKPLLGSSSPFPSLQKPKCQAQNINPSYQSRPLLTPPKAPEYKTLSEVVGALSGVIGGPSTYDPELYNKMREELVDILPKSQSELPARRMIDSYDSAIIPIGSDPTLRDRYLTHHGGVRIGILMEDMDIFAVHLVFKHLMNPLQKPGTGSPFSIVTALVDQIDFTGKMQSDCDIRISGHVTWAGSSSMECTLRLEQLVEEDWVKFTEARFLMVARDPLNRGSAFINPLQVETKEEKKLFEKGNINKKRRFEISQDSLFKVPPTQDEQEIIHDFFINTVDHKAMSFKARIKPQNSVWFEDAKLKNLIICQPEHRNRTNKIFGGFIMRQAFELGWATAYVFGKSRPFCMHMDDIWFRAPVEIGAMLYFNSQICYTQDNYIQNRISAEVVNPKTGQMSITNIFHFTFMTKDREPPSIVPKTYHEAMMYLTGRRHFENSTDQD